MIDTTLVRERGEPTPGEPPAEVTSEVLWRIASRLFRDHRAAGADDCESCRQPWPCSGRRLAELGLKRARA